MVGHEVIIGEAGLDDAAGILAVQEKMFIVTYAGINDVPEEALREHIKVLHPTLRRNIVYDIKRPYESVYFVGREGKSVVGYSGARLEDDQGHMNGLYLDTAYHGRGIGRDLMRRALDWQAPGRDIYLTVVPGTRAERFHASFGFQPTGGQGELRLYDRKYVLPNIEMKLSARDRQVARG